MRDLINLLEPNDERLKSLASEQDVSDIFNLYNDFLSPSDSIPLQEQHATIGLQLGEPIDGTDPGVEYESSLPPDELARNLGFMNGLPLLFNQYRHRGGANAWDSTSADLFEPSNAKKNKDMEPLVLHWHQLASVHAIVQMNFSNIPTPATCCGTLIADEVGLGKTFQAATTIAFLSDLVMRQSLSQSPATIPPIIRKFTSEPVS